MDNPGLSRHLSQLYEISEVKVSLSVRRIHVGKRFWTLFSCVESVKLSSSPRGIHQYGPSLPSCPSPSRCQAQPSCLSAKLQGAWDVPEGELKENPLLQLPFLSFPSPLDMFWPFWVFWLHFTNKVKPKHNMSSFSSLLLLDKPYTPQTEFTLPMGSLGHLGISSHLQWEDTQNFVNLKQSYLLDS